MSAGGCCLAANPARIYKNKINNNIIITKNYVDYNCYWLNCVLEDIIKP